MKEQKTRKIQQAGTLDANVSVPPSKSYTNRALIAAALADGPSTLIQASRSDDSEFLISALKQFGIAIERTNDDLEVSGTAGELSPPDIEVYVGNAGTAMRFLATFACLAHGESTLTGDEQMKKRPLTDLLQALHSAGIKTSSENGYPPVKIIGGNFQGGRIDIKGEISSQFVSSLLLSSPYAKHPVSICVQGKMSSSPYIDMSLHVMRSFGGNVDTLSPSVFAVSNRDRYIGRTFTIEGDASSATYFLAAAAITQGRVVIGNLSDESLQGDLRFLKVLADMGCSVVHHEDTIELIGGKLFGIEADMNELPDCVPTLAVLGAFAKGQTAITNIAQLKFKETDRLAALSTELTKLGAEVELYEDGLTIHPRPLHGASISTYNDHRMAMSFAVAGLSVPGIIIENPACVSKSFPNFWEEFSKLEGRK